MPPMEPSPRGSVRATMRKISAFMEKLALGCSAFAGTSLAFSIALFLVIAWACSGPIFHYSENWQIIINTATTIVTFLMVFLIQRAQNKDMISIHAKLNELIAAQEGASNMLVNIEDSTEAELNELKSRFRELSGPEDDTTHAKSVSETLRDKKEEQRDKKEEQRDKKEEQRDKKEEQRDKKEEQSERAS